VIHQHGLDRNIYEGSINLFNLEEIVLMCRLLMRSLFLCFLLLFVYQGVLYGAEDDGYFLSLEQKGQLIALGRIQDNEGVWYNIWICPGYVPPYRYAKKYFYKTGSDFAEYFHAEKYNDLAKNSKDAYRWAFDDCIYEFIIEGIPRTWNNNFQSASIRTDKRVFGWWFAYPWAVMESTVESIVRLPLGITGSLLGTLCGTAVVPAYYMTNSSVKGLWHLSANTIILPVVAGTWNTIISPPLSLIGQKPSLSRVDGFWVKSLTDEQVLNIEYADSPISREDIVMLGQWGILLDTELKPYESELKQVRDEAAAAFKKIRDDQKEKEKIIINDQTAKEMKIGEKESRHVENLSNDPAKQQMIELLSEQGFTSARVRARRNDIRDILKEEGVNENRIDHIIGLLMKYPPSNSTEKGFRKNSTDPLRRSIDIIKDIEPPH